MIDAERSPTALLGLVNADASALSDDEMKAVEKAFGQLPKALALLDGLSAQEKEALASALSRKRPSDKPRPTVKVAETFRVVGVVRGPTPDDPPDAGPLDEGLRDSDLILPAQTAEALFGRLPRRRENGFGRAIMLVDREENLQEVSVAVKAMGFEWFSIGVFAQQLKRNVLLIGFAMDLMALIALVVAALGIANTMFTSVLERTRKSAS